MAKKADPGGISPAVANLVTTRINAALAKNRYIERWYIAVLLFMFVTGLGLAAHALLAQSWVTAVPAGLFEIAVIWPIREILRLHRYNVALEIFPTLVRLARGPEARVLVEQLALELIKQMK